MYQLSLRMVYEIPAESVGGRPLKICRINPENHLRYEKLGHFGDHGEGRSYSSLHIHVAVRVAYRYYQNPEGRLGKTVVCPTSRAEKCALERNLMVPELLCRYCGGCIRRDYSAVYPKPANAGWETQFLPRLKPGTPCCFSLNGGRSSEIIDPVPRYPPDPGSGKNIPDTFGIATRSTAIRGADLATCTCRPDIPQPQRRGGQRI